MTGSDPSRRAFVHGAVATLGVVGCGAPGPRRDPLGLPLPPAGQTLAEQLAGQPRAALDTGAAWSDTAVATPACWDTDDFAEGPYYLADAPERVDLRTLGEAGTVFVLTGVVRGLPDCARLPDAVIEVWHADQTGAYDMDPATMHYRTRARAGFDGAFSLTTLRPPSYTTDTGTRMPQHFHLKVTAEGFSPLTTQLRFTGDPDAQAGFPASLELSPTTHADGSQSATFDLTLAP